MHVLITGGNGYIGTHLTNQFLKKGDRVTILDSFFNSNPQNTLTEGVRLFRASTTNPDTVLRAMQGVDIVYHLASRMDWSTNYRLPMRLVQNDIQGITTVCCMARMAGIQKVVFTSSAAVYGNLVGAKEEDPCNPINMYGAVKTGCESILRGFYHLGLETVILRLYNVWGRPGQRSIIGKFVEGGKEIFFEGQQSRDFVFLDDVLVALLSAQEWDSGIYNICSGEEITVNALWEIINGNKKPKYIFPGTEHPQEILRSCGDPSSTLSRTGWKAQTLISEMTTEKIKFLSEYFS